MKSEKRRGLDVIEVLDCFALLAMTDFAIGERFNVRGGERFHRGDLCVRGGLNCFALLAMTEGDVVLLQRDSDGFWIASRCSQ